jgi:hypothetical protein
MRPLDFQTFVKFIFNEGSNKMINVSEMKISLRKSPSLLCLLCPFGRKKERRERKKAKKNYTRGYKFIFATQ